MVEDQLYHITYISTGRDNLRYEDVKDILERSNVNNKVEGITGGEIDFAQFKGKNSS